MTNRAVRLVPLSVDHLSHVMGWVNDPEVMGYFANRQTPITEVEELAYMEKLLASPRTDKVWSVFDENTGDYVGQCSINAIYWGAGNGRVFLAVTKTMQGKGYAKPILKALIETGFRLGLHKLWLIVREDNVTAQKKYLEVGFKVEGLLMDEYYVHGKFHNMVRMGIISPLSFP